MSYARALAIKKHGDQKYGDEPYVVHLDAVWAVLREHGYTHPSYRDAAYLHDIIEDTAATYEELVSFFGAWVADLVWRVTDPPGKSRRERHAKTYPNIRQSSPATALKLADRIANVEHCVRTGDKRLGMYRKEQADFRAALYQPVTHDDLWARLERALAE
jgi:(p)ppGpp synthase/HD superfamily hydrolase